MNGVWSGGDIHELTTLGRTQDVILFSSWKSIKQQVQTWKTNPLQETDFKWMLTSCYSDLDWTHSVLHSLLLLSCSLCFLLAPWLRQMKMNDTGQAFSFYVLQCYMNSTKRHIYECHLLIYMYQCVLKIFLFLYCVIIFYFWSERDMFECYERQ